MPTLKNQPIYNATYEQARALIAQGKGPKVQIYQGRTPLYRYGTAKNGPAAGNHEGACKIWRPLDQDRENRWTGYAHGGPGGSVGLYMTIEAEASADTIFSELAHYQPQETESPIQMVEYFQYHRKGLVHQMAHESDKLFFMFFFLLTRPIRVYKLELPLTPDDGSFASEVFKAAKARATNIYPPGKTCINLYMDGDDASFCRALGNACLADPSCDGIQVTSTRETSSKSAVLKGVAGQAVDLLQFFGRSSFFMSADGRTTESAVTLADMQYNARHGATEFTGGMLVENGLIKTETFEL
jgi:hypothetical protein